MQLICLVNIHGFFSIKDKRGTSIVNAFKKNNFKKEVKQSLKDEGTQIKYGLIKVVNFIKILSKIF